MDWRFVDDERLIRLGELLLSLGFLEGYGVEPKCMNEIKVGRPFGLTGGHGNLRLLSHIVVIREHVTE